MAKKQAKVLQVPQYIKNTSRVLGLLNKNVKDYVFDTKNSKESFRRRQDDNWLYKHPEFKEMEKKIMSIKTKIDSIGSVI